MPSPCDQTLISPGPHPEQTLLLQGSATSIFHTIAVLDVILGVICDLEPREDMPALHAGTAAQLYVFKHL